MEVSLILIWALLTLTPGGGSIAVEPDDWHDVDFSEELGQEFPSVDEDTIWRRKRSQSRTAMAYWLTLDPETNFRLSWTPIYTDKYVQFQVAFNHLPPQSWFAVGFSNDGRWEAANLCAAWEDWKGSLHVQDVHTDEEGIIHVDNVNNCLKGDFQRGTNGSGLIRFLRPFQTCDPDDYVIEDGTTHIVYGFGPGPLYRIEGVKPSKNQSGFQRARLLKPATHLPPAPVDTRSLVVSAAGVQVPAEETTYWCHVTRLPSHLVTEKHHILQFEAAIESGHESLVHHMELFHCEAPVHQTIPEYRGSCSSQDRPEATLVCKRVLAAWAFGAGPFIYPREAGLPIGGPDFNPFVMLEVHYNNPGLRDDWIDSSGIRLRYTRHLRQYDAGVMELGLEYTDKMAIPPGQSSFTLTGYCLPECTAVSIPKSGITIFGSQLHTHLLGTRVVTRHFRRGKELAELDRDNHYSTHYQEIRLLAKPVHVLPGDALLTTCWYNSTSKTNATLGGFSISDEMCVNYVHYFPRVDLEVCKSSISWKALANYFRFMNEWEGQPTYPFKGVSDNYHSIRWTGLRAATLERMYTLAPVSMQCNQSTGQRFPGDWEDLSPFTVDLPVEKTHQPPEEQCLDD